MKTVLKTYCTRVACRVPLFIPYMIVIQYNQLMENTVGFSLSMFLFFFFLIELSQFNKLNIVTSS